MKKYIVGRHPKCDIILNDPWVAGYHAEIIINNNEVIVFDLDSVNGTFINGNRLYGALPLKHNDELKIGNTILPWANYIGPKNSMIGSSTQLQKPEIPKQTIQQNQLSDNNDEKLTCPRCGSSLIHIDKKGYSSAKGCCGFLACGPLGFLFGQSGASKLRKTCLKCNNSWY